MNIKVYKYMKKYKNGKTEINRKKRLYKKNECQTPRILITYLIKCKEKR